MREEGCGIGRRGERGEVSEDGWGRRDVVC